MSTCVGIRWNGDSMFEPCAIGEPANFMNKSICVSYDDGTEKILPIDYKMFNESNLQGEGSERRSFVKYEGFKLAVEIPLLNIKLESIEVHPQESFCCHIGEPINKSLLVVTAFYSDGTSKEIHNYKIFPFAALTERDQDIVVKYGRMQYKFPVATYLISKEPAVTVSGDSEKAESQEIHSEGEDPARLDDEDKPSGTGVIDWFSSNDNVGSSADAMIFPSSEKTAEDTSGGKDDVPIPAFYPSTVIFRYS